MSRWTRALLTSGCVAILSACSGPAPAPAAAPSMATAQIAGAEPPRPGTIACPDGSTLDRDSGACRADEPIAPRPVAGGEAVPRTPVSGAPLGATEPPSSEMDAGNAAVNVRCDFENGWLSLLPVSAYPRDDQFLMQALVGLTENPAFWGGLPEYRTLKPYAARKCTSKTESFDVKPGAYFVLAGEAGTFRQRNEYKNNGFRSKVSVAKGQPIHLHLTRGDLIHTWVCLSCPFVAFLDPESGWYERPFVVLARRDAPARRGTDRIRARARVSGGALKLRVAEVDREESHLDQLVIDLGGRTLLPRAGGARSALASADGAEVILRRGTQIVVEYDAPGIADGWVDVEVVAHGHYEPTDR